jgi:hypothetical protein
MKTKTSIYPIYDLANAHFKNAEIITKDNQSIKGQFVRFKVNGVGGQCIYPAEKYCFLPKKYNEVFAEEFASKKGEFNKVPEYIMFLGLDDISEIIIKPVLII